MKNRGFTLIELIVVMVILGVMAVTVAPRFMNLTGEANQSVLNGVAAAINSSSAMVYGKAAVKGLHKKSSTDSPKVTTDANQEITLNFGYPTATAAGLMNTLDIKANESPGAAHDFGFVTQLATNTVTGVIYIYPKGLATAKLPVADGTRDGITCAIKYTEASSSTDNEDVTTYTAAAVTTHFSGC